MGKQQNFFHFSKQISSLLLFSSRPRWNQHHETRHVKQEFNSQSQPLPWPCGSSHKRQLSRLRSQNTRQGNNTLAQELFPRSLTVENVKGKITCSVSADKLEIKTEKGGERKKKLVYQARSWFELRHGSNILAAPWVNHWPIAALFLTSSWRHHHSAKQKHTLVTSFYVNKATTSVNSQEIRNNCACCNPKC